MITLIKLNQRTTLVHHLFVLQPTAAAMFWRHTGVSTTSCIGLSACPICWGHPNGLHSIAYAFDQTACDKLETCGRKEREKSKTQLGGTWSQRGPRVEITKFAVELTMFAVEPLLFAVVPKTTKIHSKSFPLKKCGFFLVNSGCFGCDIL